MTIRAVLLAAGVAFGAIGLAGTDDAHAQQRERGTERFIERFFELFDTKGEGRVGLAEIIAEHERIFQVMDVAATGEVTVDEFRRRGHLYQSLRTTTLFDLVDTNGDGRLTLDELTAPSARWFKRIDTDGDGYLSEPELEAWLLQSRRGRR